LVTGLVFLSSIVVVRMVVRKLWAADLIAVALFTTGFAMALGGGWQRFGLVMAVFLPVGLVWIRMMHRFGFLALVTLWTFAFTEMFIPLTASGWMAKGLITMHLIPVAVALWAVWVILSDAGRHSTELA
jgi:hypothetical protein